MDLSSPQKLLISSRRNRVVQMRIEGKTLESIAETISDEYSLPNYNKSRAYDDFLASCAKHNKLTATEVSAYRRLEELRLDLMWEKLLPLVRSGDLKAIEVGCKLSRAKSQLMGLDAANQAIVRNSIEVELNGVLDDFQRNLSPELYEKILTILATKSGKTDDDDDDDDD